MTTDSGADEGVLGYLCRAVVRASGAEVRRAHGEREFDAGTTPRLLVDPRLRGVDVMTCETIREAAGDGVDVELAEAGEQCRPVLVDLADDARCTRMTEQDVAHHRLDEVALLLDDDDLVEITARGAEHEAVEDVPLDRVDHPQLEDADAQTAQVVVADVQQAQRLSEIEVGLARGDDADSIVGGRHHDLVDPVEPRILQGAGDARGELILFELHEIGAQQSAARYMGAPSEIAVGGDDPVGIDVGGRRAVGDVGRDLQRRPQPADAAHDRRVHAEVEDVLRVGRVEDRDVEIGQGHLRRARHRRGLRAGVVADERDGASGRMRTYEVGVPDRVGGAVEAGGLAVPVADDAVAGRAVGGGSEVGDLGGDLRAHHRGGGDLLVQSGAVGDVVGREEGAASSEFEVVAGEGRAFVAGDERGGVQVLAAVDASAVADHADQGRDAGEVDRARLASVPVVEREAVRTGL